MQNAEAVDVTGGLVGLAVEDLVEERVGDPRQHELLVEGLLEVDGLQLFVAQRLSSVAGLRDPDLACVAVGVEEFS